MGRIILSEILNDIRNRVGSNIYFIDRGVHCVRFGPDTIENPNTALQQTRRVVLRDAQRRWFGNLTQSQRDKWETYARSLGSAADSNKTQGANAVIHFNRKNMTGSNAYTMVQMVRRSAGFAGWRDDPPIGQFKPTQPRNLVLTFSGAPLFQLTVTWDDPLRMPAAAKIRVWARSWNWAHAQILGVAAKGVQTFTWSQMRGDNGVPGNLVSGAYYVQLDCVRTYGVWSVGSQVARIVIAVP